MTLMKRIWNDEAGFIVSTELMLIATIVVIALVVGLTAIRDAITAELSDVAGAINEVDQSYTVWGVTGHSAAVAGFDYADYRDYCDFAEDVVNTFDNCISVSAVNDREEAPVAAPSPINSNT